MCVGDQAEPLGSAFYFTCELGNGHEPEETADFLGTGGKAERAYLSHVNYYKLTGYTLQFRKEAESSNLATSHTFSEIKKLYDFDADMRQMLRGYLEIVETYCKTQIANSFALEKCMTPPYDQHYNEANYYNKIGFQHIMQIFG